MTEDPKKKAKQTKKPKLTGKTIFDTTNQALVEMFNTTANLISKILDTGKTNPAQGLLGTILVADLLHGGALACANSERPYLVGKASKYFGTTKLGAVDFFPIPGFNLLDPFSSILQGIEGLAETQVGGQIVAEVYMNANCPTRFPKLLSDEAYSKILLFALYMSHTEVFRSMATGIKTFVEGNAIQMKATGELFKDVAGSTKDLKPLLSLLESEGV
jgi:hypothetical protein